VIKYLEREIRDRFSFNNDQSSVSVMTRNYIQSQLHAEHEWIGKRGGGEREREREREKRDLHLTANGVTFKKTTVDSISMSYLPTSKLRSL